MLGAVTLAVGEVLAFGAFAVGEAVLRSPAPHATLGQPGVLRAVLKPRDRMIGSLGIPVPAFAGAK